MLHFDIDLAITEGDFDARVTAAGDRITVAVSDPARLPFGTSGRLRDLRVVAAALARRGVSVEVTGPAGTIVRIGAVKASPVQRVVTWSPHVVLGSPAAVAPLLLRNRSSARPEPLPLPPGTLFPLAPTLARHRRHRPTTTHAVPGSGRPRLIFVVGSEHWDGKPPREFDLLPEVTRIGSGPDCDLRLPGLEALHAEIRHDAADEYVLHAIGPVGGGAGWPGDDASSRGWVLRTGARIELGEWRFGYFREEFADHGRPFGGRVGGELAVQKPQPPRPRGQR